MGKELSKTNKIGQHKKALLEALEKSLGVVTTACKHVGISRTTFYQWMKDDAGFAAEVKELDNVTLDFVESQLHKQIKGGNTTATIFFLKTKGKDRGYVERQEITGVDGAPLSTNYDFSTLSLKERKEFIDYLDKLFPDAGK